MNGALLISKQTGISSFGVIEQLQKQMYEKGLRKRDLPKLGHGGTLDPFATGLLVVLVGRAVKLARYFLGASKSYEGLIRFGETSIPGDPTGPISETSLVIPTSRAEVQAMATLMMNQPYLQTPPMHSAKKKNGVPLYELARQGIEIERDPKLCHLYDFSIVSYHAPQAGFTLRCSSGTYVRALAKDLATHLGSVALLDTLHRTSSGVFNVAQALSTEEIFASQQKWDELPCWIPFDQLLSDYDRAEATEEERVALVQGKQEVLTPILGRMQSNVVRSAERSDCIALYCADALIAIARKDHDVWGLERVFT